MIAAVVLAAGESRRMGRQKLLLPFGEKTVIEHVVDRVLASAVDRVVVVTGRDHDALETAIGNRNVAVVCNARYAEGMLSSVRCGVAAFSGEVRGFLFVLGDQPSVSTDTINRLLDEFRTNRHGIVVPACGDRTGHPVVVASRFRDAIMTRFDGVGLRGLLREYPGEVSRLQMQDDTVLFDMDTPTEYERERARNAHSTGKAVDYEE